MATRPNRPENFPAKRATRKATSYSHYRRRSSPHCSKSTTVSDKLEALKNLIPTQESGAGDNSGSADRLFKETADYILLLRTQVSVLQKLVDFYSSSSSQANQHVQQ